MNTEIITLEEARRQGLKTYYTGVPCKYGHLAYRAVGNHNCSQCHRERMNKIQRQNLKDDPNFNRRKHMKKKYGLTIEEYDQMIEDQEGKCLTCQAPFTETGHIDHCHSTGRVRGLLCGSCNRALGLVKDNPETLARMIDYLKG